MTAPDDALAAIEARAAAATPARERIAQRFGENAAVIQHATDVVIASAADVPTLLAALRTLAAEVAGARAATAAVNVARNADLAAFDEERAQHAGDVAAAVAGERARARRCTIYSERFDGCSMIDALQAARGMIENGEDDEVCEYCHDTGVNAASSKPCRCCEWARVLAADALAAPTGGGE